MHQFQLNIIKRISSYFPELHQWKIAGFELLVKWSEIILEVIVLWQLQFRVSVEIWFKRQLLGENKVGFMRRDWIQCQWSVSSTCSNLNDTQVKFQQKYIAVLLLFLGFTWSVCGRLRSTSFCVCVTLNHICMCTKLCVKKGCKCEFHLTNSPLARKMVWLMLMSARRLTNYTQTWKLARSHFYSVLSKVW